MFKKKQIVTLLVGSTFLFAFNTAVLAENGAKATQQRPQQHGDHEHHSSQASSDHQHQCEQMMQSVDANKDGKISKEEFIAHHQQMFDKKDANKDGFLDREEMHQMMNHMNEHHHHCGQHQKNSDHSHAH